MKSNDKWLKLRKHHLGFMRKIVKRYGDEKMFKQLDEKYKKLINKE